MYHIRGQNSHYKKLVCNERIKEGSKNAPKANLTPRWPAANVIFENVCCAIDLNCKKVIPRKRLPAPPHRVAR